MNSGVELIVRFWRTMYALKSAFNANVKVKKGHQCSLRNPLFP